MQANLQAQEAAFSRLGQLAPDLEFTGERIVPGKTEEALFREHEERYVFAGQYVTGKDVLDVACGTGIGTAYLLQAGARSCVGVDIDKGTIDYAKANYKGCMFAQSDATELPLPDASVDVVVSFETIEHVRNQERFLEECRRVLRTGGLLICSTPNLAISRWGEHNPFHVHELTVREFRRLVETKFGNAEMYAQGVTAIPLHVCRVGCARLLEWLRIRKALSMLKKAICRETPPLPMRDEFCEEMGKSLGIAKCKFHLFALPTYILAVAARRAS